MQKMFVHCSRLILAATLLLSTAACSSSVRYNSTGAGSTTSRSSDGSQTQEQGTRRGVASYYGNEFQGRLTANGERFDQNQMTAAHRTLPFGTKVRVKHVNNGREVVVRINDRGPFVDGRIIDLSRAAAEQLDMIREGVAMVEITILR